MTSSLERLGAVAADTGSPAKKRQRTDGAVSFTQLLRTVRTQLPEQDRGGLSVAIGFICALHLCNDHDLELQNDHGDEVFDTLNARLGDFHVHGMEMEEDSADPAEA